MSPRYKSGEDARREERAELESNMDNNPDYKPTARDLTYIVEFPSKEVVDTFREMQRWIRKGLPLASSGDFLSSRLGPSRI